MSRRTTTRPCAAPTSEHHTLTGLNRAVIANRLSYFLGLRGPSLVVDTGQSSSLVAVHLACESLRRGEADVALAGGVHLNLVPDSALTMERFGGLSPDGRCYTFDERANGFVRGEGGALVLLKPLAAALADGDDVYCVIEGSAVNNDGGGDGLTVPNPAARKPSSVPRAGGPVSNPVSSTTSSCTGPAPGSAIRSRLPRSVPSTAASGTLHC